MPYLYDMAERFTKYRLYHILILKSSYSIALYEWFKSWAYKKIVTVDISALRSYLGISNDKYVQYKIFRRDLLDRCIKEIEGQTDLRITYRPIRMGRSYSRIEFTIKEVDEETAAEVERRALALLNGINYIPGQGSLFDYPREED